MSDNYEKADDLARLADPKSATEVSSITFPLSPANFLLTLLLGQWMDCYCPARAAACGWYYWDLAWRHHSLPDRWDHQIQLCSVQKVYNAVCLRKFCCFPWLALSTANPPTQRENIAAFLKAASSFGVPEHELFETVRIFISCLVLDSEV